VATLVDRMKINGSVARAALKDLEERGVIRKVVSHARLVVYSTFLIFYPPSNAKGLFWSEVNTR